MLLTLGTRSRSACRSCARRRRTRSCVCFCCRRLSICCVGMSLSVIVLVRLIGVRVCPRGCGDDWMRIGYADPPYVGQSVKHYGDHKDFAGEVDHALLISELVADFDGFVLHCSSTSLSKLLQIAPSDSRVGAWVKPFAAFKKNVPVAYAWEPVIFKPARKQSVHGTTQPLRDFISEPITMKRGLAGAKPRRVCWWAFECAGCEPEDDLVDLFPGSGAVSDAWIEWCDLMLDRPVQGGLFEASQEISRLKQLQKERDPA